MESDIQGFTLVTISGQLVAVYGWQFAYDFAANPDAYQDDTTDYSGYSETVAKLLRFRYRSAVTYLDPGTTDPAHSYRSRIDGVATLNQRYTGTTNADLSAHLIAKSAAVSGLIDWLRQQIIVRGGLIESDVAKYGQSLKIGQAITQVGSLVALLPGANLIGAGLVFIGQDFASNNGNANNALERKRQIEVAAAEISTLQGYQALANAQIQSLTVPDPTPDKIPAWVWALAGVGFVFVLGLLYNFLRSGRRA